MANWRVHGKQQREPIVGSSPTYPQKGQVLNELTVGKDRHTG